MLFFLSIDRQKKKSHGRYIYIHSLIEANRFEELAPESSDNVRIFDEDFDVDAALVDEEVDPPAPLTRRSLVARSPTRSTRPRRRASSSRNCVIASFNASVSGERGGSEKGGSERGTCGESGDRLVDIIVPFSLFSSTPYVPGEGFSICLRSTSALRRAREATPRGGERVSKLRFH